ncbi:mitochondrial ATPase inhibitor IATP-domain-containing protein [Apiospora arundinis]|uniref:ATPase inhibitor, mitochondrial n=1 Tax=Apiospora arundinis TaxID=335852 RepID=A0ABR2J9N2_9PEZI
MYRQSVIKASSGLTAYAPRRAFTTSLRVMSEGDTGSPRLGGSNDAFVKREKANEDYTIKLREKEKLLELKKKLAQQQEHLKQLSDHINDLTREQGGEHN